MGRWRLKDLRGRQYMPGIVPGFCYIIESCTDMVIVLEEVDLHDDKYSEGDYDPTRLSIQNFNIDKESVEKARLVTFRYRHEGDLTFRDLKNSYGHTSVHTNSHPTI